MYKEIFIDFGFIEFYCYIWEALLTIAIIIAITSTSLAVYFYLKYKNNKSFVNNNDNFENSMIYIRRLMKKSGLSELICTDIYKILIDFINDNRDSAYAKIYLYLIPHLKDENVIGNVGIAFGMLIDDIALSENEALQITQKVIEEMLPKQ